MQTVLKKAAQYNNKFLEKFIISRTGTFYAIWNFLIALLCVWSSLFYLELAAFGIPERGELNDTFDIVFVFIFFLDLLVRLNLDYYDRIKEITVKS